MNTRPDEIQTCFVSKNIQQPEFKRGGITGVPRSFTSARGGVRALTVLLPARELPHVLGAVRRRVRPVPLQEREGWYLRLIDFCITQL